MANPLAQTFNINPVEFPEGCFIHSVDLCFRRKDEVTFLPISVQIRPTIEGFPHAFQILPFAEVSLTPDRINTISENPNFDSAANFTRFTFEAPVYLTTGDYAIVIETNSDLYEIYVAELGKKRLDGSDRLVSKQPYAGVLFKSSNGSLYSPEQNSDIMFRLNRCSFTNDTTTVTLHNNSPEANVVYQVKHFVTQDLKLPGTSINYFSRPSLNGPTPSLTASFSRFEEDLTIELINEETILTTGNTHYIRMDLSSTSNVLSPMIDLTRVQLTAIENIINDGELTSSNFIITEAGSGYTGNTSVTITADQGSGANAFAEVANGNVVSVVMTSKGSNYLGGISAVIGDPPVPSGNTTATVYINNELDSSGGNALARYITKKVTLNDGFDSTSLRVYFDAVNKPEHEISVYYKVLSFDDNEDFDNRPYVKMSNVQLGNENLANQTKSNQNDDFREYFFIPPNDDCSYTGTLDPTTYQNFRVFAIKIVMTTSDKASVPKVKNLRAIAIA